MDKPTGEPPRTPDDPETIRQAQERVRQVLADAEGVAYAYCEPCGALIMHVFTLIDGWRWFAVLGQGDTPAPQCPKVAGPNGIGHGPHLPRATEIPFRTGDPT
jgi:hypothetical protein